MNPLLHNRGFQLPADGWIHLVPIGEFPKEDLGVIQVIDADSIRAIHSDFVAQSKQPRFAGLLVDFDHFSLRSDRPSEAAGWITEVETRADGVWGKVRWTDTGDAAVKGGRYRMVSPVFSRRDADDLGNGRLRPRRLLSVALTNDPNIRGMEPVANCRREIAHSTQIVGAEITREVMAVKIANCCSWADAWTYVQADKPEMFARLAMAGVVEGDQQHGRACAVPLSRSKTDERSLLIENRRRETGCTFDQAWTQIQAEFPHLFGLS